MEAAKNSAIKKLLQGFFTPAVALMSRLNITAKFVLLGLMSLAAVAVVVYNLFASLDQVISLSQRELKGLELIRPFPNAVQTLQQHRGLSAGIFGGEEAMGERRSGLQREAARAMNALRMKLSSDSVFAESLQRIGADWERLLAEGINWTAEENFAAHTRLIERIQLFEAAIADEYALTLDPELDTYYLIDTIVNKLPHALEHFGQLRARGTRALASQRITAQQRIEMDILMAELDDALALLKVNLDKTGRYNPQLQGVIQTAFADITDSAQQISNLIRSDILSSRLTATTDDFFGMSTTMIDQGYAQLHDALLPMAETLIRERIARAKNTLYVSIGIAALLILVVAYFSIGIVRAIIVNIRSLVRSAHAFADGDLNERVNLASRDELGLVGNSFNEMAFGMRTLLEASRSSEARLKELSAHLEERVKKRTIELEKAQRETQMVLQRYQVLMQTSMDGIHIMDLQGNIMSANEAFCRMLGYTWEELSALEVGDWCIECQTGALRERLCELAGKGGMFETAYRCKDGTLIDAEVSASGVKLEGQDFICASSRDITRRKESEKALRIAAVAFETHDAIVITDAGANIIRVNQAFTDITGYSLEEVLGKNPNMMSSGRHDESFYTAMWQQLTQAGTWSGEIWDRRKNGQIYPKWITITAVKNTQGAVTEYVGIFSDITERKQAEEAIHNLAFYDALTRLPNRRLFLDRFNTALVASVRHNNYGALLFIDMDRFKLLNDTLGHDYGDLLLIEVAARIRSCVREMDTVARLGGDEFVVLIESVSDDQDEASHKIGLVAEKIRESLARPYHLNGHEHQSSPSIGVSLYRGNDETVDELLQHADMAMYQAKESGRNAVRFFDPVMQDNVATRAALVNDLRSAIERQQLQLYYQMQVDNDNRPVGAEALLRWLHPQRGTMLPEQFLPIAEESTLIIDVGDWVLEAACRQLARWGEIGKMRDLVLTVNISAKQFVMPDFAGKVAAKLQTHRVNPARLKLELTESMALDDWPAAIEKMRALKALGVCLSMDDFGTRYASLSNLKQLPLDQVKLGRSFVQDVANDGNVALLVQSIIDMSSRYRITVIAEGVENLAQLASLKDRDCVAYQGFLFSEAVPVGEFEKLLGRDGMPWDNRPVDPAR